jgi:hypothetical protein
MGYRYIEINGTKILRHQFNDTKSEQEFLARFPKDMDEGFVTVHRWGPGHTSANRAEERYISTLDFFVAPIVDGKVVIDLGADSPDPIPAKVSLEIPPELDNLTDKQLLEMCPQVGAKANPRMPRKNLMAALALAIKKNPKNWESVKLRFADNELKRGTVKAQAVTA